MKQAPPGTVWLMQDETVLRWFPPLRYAWAFRGEQARVPISGRNAKRVLFGALNPRTGHRLVLRRHRHRQEDFQVFLHYLRQHYRGRPLWLFLDKARWHDAAKSRQLAERLGIEFLWLPKQCPELNSMDQLWKDLKRLVAANRQFRSVDELAEHAERWVLGLTPQEARTKAGVLSEDFWLKAFL